MSDLEKLKIVIQYEFLKHFRRKRLYIVLGIALLVEALVLILIPVLMEQGYPDDALSMAALLTAGPGLAVIGAVFFAGDAVAGEFEGKTGFLLFINPVKRVVLWVGKYLAGFLATTILVVFSYIIISIALLAIYQQVPVELLKSFGLCMLYAASVLSVTFLFSAVSKGSMGATVMTLLFIFVVCGILESVLMATGKPYWFILSTGGDSITAVLTDMSKMFESLGIDPSRFGSMLENYKPMDVSLAAVGMVIYLVVGFAGSLWFSNRRQLA
ncbi:MAG: ABC transporter permease [Dehalococcoidales bacterium]|nr:ABC transporter permease [Dehalococcoidales bacterium]